MKTVLAWLGIIAFGIGAFFLQLFTFVKIWALIAIPMGAPQIDQWQAYGVACLIGHFVAPTLTQYTKDKTGEGMDRAIKHVATSIVISLMSWGIVNLIFG